MELLPLVMIAPLLAWGAWSDLRRMQIPNALSLAAVAVFAAAAAVAPPDDLLPRVTIAAAVLGIGFASYLFGLFGGGDVKMLSALLLFVPVSTLSLFAYVFSASMLAGILIVLSLRRLPAAQGLGWKSISGSTGFPMGLSIAMAGIAHPAAVALAAV
ncbi:prepilin peptidase [Albidovulum sp.]|uniref:prepilin peptidase n=1 Tax=Albidovulum sp. TaxID=1872424 RepID=UPI0039B92346